MGRRRRRSRSRAKSAPKKASNAIFNSKLGAVTNRRTASQTKNRAASLAQRRLNKSAQTKAAKTANSSVAGKYQNQSQRTGPKGGFVNPSGNRGKGGSSPTTPTGALNMQNMQAPPRPGRGRGKGSRPIAHNERTMQGGGFRNKAFGMGREQRGFGMGRMNMQEQMANRAFGMGRDQRGMGMGREEMMKGIGFGGRVNERSKGGSRPTSGTSSQGTRINSLGMEVPRGQQFRSKPAGMGRGRMPQGRPNPYMRPNRGVLRTTQAAQRPQTSSFNPATGRMEFASTPNNFSRGSQNISSLGAAAFRKTMKPQGGFKLPPKSQIQK